MDSVSLGGQSNVGAGVDQQSGSSRSVIFLHLGQDVEGFASQRFQVARGEIFFPQLDVVNPGLSGFGNFCQQETAARGFVFGKRFAVGDVVEERAVVHLVWSLTRLGASETTQGH